MVLDEAEAVEQEENVSSLKKRVEGLESMVAALTARLVDVYEECVPSKG